MEAMGEGAVMFIRQQGTDRFVQFTKYVDARELSYLQFGLPDAPWSRDYLGSLERAVSDGGFECEFANSSNSNVRRTLIVEIEGEYWEVTKGAVRIATLALDTLGAPESATFTIWIEGRGALP